jgi:hypothetical protein
MRKEIQIEDTTTEYYCDGCGEQQHDSHWSYGGYESAGEALEKCVMCGKEFCNKCRTQFRTTGWDYEICKECANKYVETLDAIKANFEEYTKNDRALHDKLFSNRVKK